MKTQNSKPESGRRGSTLLIVLSLLSLLAFTGMVFFTFAAQDRASAEVFSEAAKATSTENGDAIPWGLEQVFLGATDAQKASILWGPKAPSGARFSRHSIVHTAMGTDLIPFSGVGHNIPDDQSTNGAVLIDNDHDGTPDTFGAEIEDPRNFVDALTVWGGLGLYNQDNLERTLYTERQVGSNGNNFPEPDVDYTYADLNNVFLACKGWAIRDNGTAHVPAAERYERVPVFIPSFMRPALLNSGTSNGPMGTDLPTDPDWWDNTATHGGFALRSMHPHPDHIAGYASGVPVRRFLDQNNAADATIIAGLPGAHGPFPFRPSEGVNSADYGKMGVWTGDDPGSAGAAANFELASDNDGDGIKEGVWLDLAYPVQETPAGILYATLHSFTVYDLDSLLDLNIHGNLAGLPRDVQITNGTPNTILETEFLSQSNLGLGPNEVSLLWALAPNSVAATANAAFVEWYGEDPTNRLEEANMQLLWLLTGRVTGVGSAATVYDGRWGDANALAYHYNGGGNRAAWSLPRPGRAGDLTRTTADPVWFLFGGHRGFDDNLNIFEGVANNYTGTRRGFVHPLDFSGSGTANRIFNPSLPALFNPLMPSMLQDDVTRPERWLQYTGYSLVGEPGNIQNDSPYIRGRDGSLGTTLDNLVVSPEFNALLDDPLETIYDLDAAVRPDDQMFAPSDLVPAHLSKTDIVASQGEVSSRLKNLAPVAFADDSNIAERFTTISNQLRSIVMSQSESRPFEDAFPGQFGAIAPYSATDPLRPQARRLLTGTSGTQREIITRLPLSVNQIIDVERSGQTPVEGTSQFRAYMERAGLRFRALTEHPAARDPNDHSTKDIFAKLVTGDIPTVGTPAGDLAMRNFPPRSLADREFWARRDRQQMARDIYVLLYMIGGADQTGSTIVNPFTIANGGYTNQQLRRMAQFAVNMVDAMDTDNVATRFEYDRNLLDGWRLDDDATTDEDPPTMPQGLYPEDGDVFRGVVYGIERQEIAFSEVFAARMEDFRKFPGSADDPSTMWDDTNGGNPFPMDEQTDRNDRLVLHFELQNLVPMAVPLSVDGVTGLGGAGSDGDQAIWQVARFDRSTGTAAPQDLLADQELNFMDGNAAIAGGDRFTVSMAAITNQSPNANPLGTGTADLFLSDDGTSFEQISPAINLETITAGGMPSGQKCDLDTIVSAHDTRYVYRASNAEKGKFLEDIEYAADGTTAYNGNDEYQIPQAAASNSADERTGEGFDLVIRRRANPNLPLLDLTENPWIEVDRIPVEFKDLFNFSDDGMGNFTVTADFNQLTGYERAEPLVANMFASDGNHPPVSATDLKRNTIGAVFNHATDALVDISADPMTGDPILVRPGSVDSTGYFDVWQTHFDRDFATPAELLNVPVVGPRLLTSRSYRMRFPPAQQSRASNAELEASNFSMAPGVTGTPVLDNISSAGGMFLQPNLGSGAIAENNAWYRLFGFVEVPSRVNSMIGNYVNRIRTPGKINVNGIRHVEVFAGLLDDPVFANVPAGTDHAPFMADSLGTDVSQIGLTGAFGNLTVAGSNQKDRWFDLVQERDGAVNAYSPTLNAETRFWLPGTGSARPFRGDAYTPDNFQLGMTPPAEGMARTARTEVGLAANRNWLEVGGNSYHQSRVTSLNERSPTNIQAHQLLSRVQNNTTTLSNAFIVYATVGYFEAYEDPSGLIRVGGRMGLDVDGDGDEQNDSGWEERAAFVVDRTELINAFDSTTGSFDWQRLVKYRIDLPSDGQ